ncbi:chemotaxis protein CheA [Salidesulfovibrio onnuriiensis]|uniref:chemotaxis protein CheA n=1 Tax=Salidesulfovibrio onnuriiensis TaxID=2583823 RepID=UPI0011C93B6D|nr:chemotaxis protein CheW [Salidesulfovibrio onnuriiensis]
MRDNILECIEELEKEVLDLEAGKGSGVDAIMNALGLSRMKVQSAQVIAILDMLTDGITPITPDIVTAMLGVAEAEKKFLYSLAGILDEGPAILKASEVEAEAKDMEAAEEAIAAAMGGGAATSEGADSPASPAPEAEQEKAKPAKQEAPDKPMAAQAISSIRVPTDRLDRVIELVGKLMVTYAVIAQSGMRVDSKITSSLRELDNVIGRLQQEVDAIRLVPLKQIFMPMHRLVKSLSQKIGKKLDFNISGEELALDKTIVESLNEPLVHLLRNAVDHGMEMPDERTATGKKEVGDVRLNAWRKGEHAFIEVSDDGRGLNPEKILNKALEKGLADPETEYTEDEILQFVLMSGFSTAEKITDVSGRGVGMDAVVNAIKVGLDGDIVIKSELGKGAAFTISIPLDRSANEGIVDALVCKVGGDVFIIPSRDVVEIYVPQPNEVVELPDGRETVDVRGHVHSLLRLADFLGLEAEVDRVDRAQSVVVRTGDYRAAILVDEVIRQQQVVITRFTVPVEQVYDLPILGYGMMGESDALVIDVEDLLQKVDQSGGTGNA